MSKRNSLEQKRLRRAAREDRHQRNAHRTVAILAYCRGCKKKNYLPPNRYCLRCSEAVASLWGWSVQQCEACGLDGFCDPDGFCRRDICVGTALAHLYGWYPVYG